MSTRERVGLFGAYAVGNAALVAPFSLLWSLVMVAIAVVVGTVAS